MQGSRDIATTLHCKQAVSAEAADLDAGDPPFGGSPVIAYAGLQLPGFGFPLQGHHPGEFAAACFQLRGQSLLGDMAVFENHHFVGGFHRAHAMRDHDDRFAC